MALPAVLAEGWDGRRGGGGDGCAQHTGCAVVLEIRFLTERR